MEDVSEPGRSPANIKVVGIGGGGSNAVNRMIESGVGGVEFIAVNTDAPALALSRAPIRVRIGPNGLGSGGDRTVGARSADESRDELRTVLEDADMVFVTAGMGGGTGTGAAPIVAEMAKEMGALTVAVVTKPFTFEGSHRSKVAEEGLKELEKHVDALVAIENDRLLELVDRSRPLQEAFSVADDILRQGIQGISDVITQGGDINTDFADVRAIMTNGGAALMAVGRASGEDRALKAARQVISSSLLDLTIAGADGLLVNIKGGQDMGLFEVDAAANLISQMAAPDAKIKVGAVVDEDLYDVIEITVIATGSQLGQSQAMTPTSTTAERRPREERTFRSFDNRDLDIPSFLRRR